MKKGQVVSLPSSPVTRPIAAGYVRVSRDKTKHGQADEIVSPETQKEYFRRFAEMRGLSLAGPAGDLIWEDLDYSGYRMHYSRRPGLMEIMKLAEQHQIQYLLVYKVSRLSRRLREFLEIKDFFEKHGVSLISVTESIDTSTPYGRAALNMLATFAQLQSDELSEYISNTKATQARQGIMPGGRSPYGLIRKGGKVTADPSTFPTLQKMFELAAGGATGYDIGQWLRGENIPGPNGGEWWDEEIRRILKNPVYIGKFQFGGETHDGRHEAFIDEDLFHRAQTSLSERSRVQGERHNRMLSGLIVCGSCGSQYNVHHGGGNSKDRGYQCRNRFHRDGCKAPRVDAPTLEAEVRRRLLDFVQDPGQLQAAHAKVAARLRRTNPAKEKARLEAELAKVRQMLSTLFEDYHERQIITAEQFADMNRRYLERARQAEMALAAYLAADPEAELRELEMQQAALGGLAGMWDDVSEAERARVLQHIGLQLVVREDHVEMQLFDLIDDIPGYTPWSTMYFGPAVTDRHYQGRFWSLAQEEYLLQHWETQTAEQISQALQRPMGGVRIKIWNLQKEGRLHVKGR